MPHNPYQAPQAELVENLQDDLTFEYVGFWPRVIASLLDGILLSLLITPVLLNLYGEQFWTADPFEILGVWDLLLNWIFPITAVLLFWHYYAATPGKMLVNCKIVDADTGQHPIPQQFIIRYLGYIIAILPLLLGIIWVAFDKRKQGWHDKLARTVVIKNNP